MEQTLHMVLQRRHPAAGLLPHTDRGSQYTSTSCCVLLTERGITVSMSRKGDCWDDALIESVWAILKGEWTDRQVFVFHQEAQSVVFEYLAVF